MNEAMYDEWQLREDLFQLRKHDLGYTRKEMATRYGIPWSRIKKIENGDMDIRSHLFRDYLERIVDDLSAIDENLVPISFIFYLKHLG